MNALTQDVMDGLEAALLKVRDDPSIRAAVLFGAGDRAFVAGADIGELSRLDAVSGRATAERGHQVLGLIEGLNKPVIAAIQGYALGGGLELAMACTLRIAAEGARLGQPEVGLGLIPGYGGTQRLPRLVGRGRALELLLTGRMLDAAEAERIGLIEKVIPKARLLEEAEGLARLLAGQPREAVEAILRVVRQGLELGLAEGLKLEAELFGEICGTEDMREGTRAFLEKRKPKFQG
jgi:enoyl-CoA hydratase